MDVNLKDDKDLKYEYQAATSASLPSQEGLSYSNTKVSISEYSRPFEPRE